MEVKYVKYIIDNPFVLNGYNQLVGADILDSFRSGNRLCIQQFYLQEYNTTKAIYISLGNPTTAIMYSKCALSLVPEIIIDEIIVAVFLSYVAELYIARGSIDPLIKPILDIAENHAIKAPCGNDVRIKTLANIYLLRSISEKALGNRDDAFNLLSVLSDEKWVKENGSDHLLISINRQKVMMTQSLQAHMDILESAEKIKNILPLEYYRTIKRVFEYATNYGLNESIEKLMPKVLLAFSNIQNGVPSISKISLLKNLGQANGLLGNTSLAKLQLKAALKEATNKKLMGQITQINRIADAIDEGNIIGSLLTFRVN